jgi:hypothetical protein
MSAAKSGDQEVRAGEVFVESAGKTGFPGFGFSRQGDNRALRAEDGSRREKLQRGGSKEGNWMYTGCVLVPDWIPKWEFRLNRRRLSLCR